MRYTGDVHAPPGPYVIHYGIDWEVTWKDHDGFDRQYSFNKLLYLSLDAASCPRWFFPLPPYTDEAADPGAGRKNYRDALCGRQIATFNAALCDYYDRHCMVRPRCPPASAELARKERGWCVDLNQNCLNWARRGECVKNPSFMKDECAQSCGMCADRDAHPLLGRPEVTCVDTAPAASCASLVHLDACTSQRPYMLEACRRSCNFCNASADAFPEGKEPQRDDTAAHACPDGSDLGGGKVLIASKDPKQIAAEEFADQQDQAASATLLHPPGPPRSPESHESAGQRRSKRSAAATVVAATEVASPKLSPRRRDSVASLQDDAHEHLALDAAVASWPFLLVQGLMLLAAGYSLRGAIDRRARAKRPQIGSAVGRTHAMRL